MEAVRESAARARSAIVAGRATPAAVRAALAQVPRAERDRWVDLVLGTDVVPDDGPHLPPGCVPYLPCPVEALLRVIDQAGVHEGDVFVDVGGGVGRAAALTHLATGAAALGLEVQPHLARAFRAMAARLRLARVSVIEGDAAQALRLVPEGTVFFFYCPFGGARLAEALDHLEAIARARPIRVCAVDLPLPPRPWLAPRPSSDGAVAVYESGPPLASHRRA